MLVFFFYKLLKVKIGKPTISSPSIVIAPHTLDVGSYCVHFVTGYQYTNVFMSVFYTVNVTASKLKAFIKGGSTRSEYCQNALLIGVIFQVSVLSV